MERDKGVHTVAKGICPKGNLIVQLEFELQDVNYYAVGALRFYVVASLENPIEYESFFNRSI